MCNFEKVSALNTFFGNPKGDTDNPDWDAANKQGKLITEELEELLCGIAAKNVLEIRDAIADVLVTTYGLAHALGIDANADMETVQQSNLSKLCGDEQELEETLAYYSDLGIPVYAGGEFPNAYVKVEKDHTCTVEKDGLFGKFYPKGKFLKNVNWHEPVFD